MNERDKFIFRRKVYSENTNGGEKNERDTTFKKKITFHINGFTNYEVIQQLFYEIYMTWNAMENHENISIYILIILYKKVTASFFNLSFYFFKFVSGEIKHRSYIEETVLKDAINTIYRKYNSPSGKIRLLI